MTDNPRRVLPIRALLLATSALVAAAPSMAADVSITNDRIGGVESATASAGQPANVFVGSGGSVTIDLGVALTLNSNNTINVDGTVTSIDDDNVTGILARGGFAGSVVNDVLISLTEDYSPTDTDSYGDLDGAFASGANRIGIHVQGPGPFTGTVETRTESTIQIEGNDSAAIKLSTAMFGDVTNKGALTVLGRNAVGLAVHAQLTGSAILNGTINATLRWNCWRARIVGGRLAPHFLPFDHNVPRVRNRHAIRRFGLNLDRHRQGFNGPAWCSRKLRQPDLHRRRFLPRQFLFEAGDLLVDGVA